MIGNGYRGLVTIGGIRMMYDTMYSGFNFNLDHGRSD